RGIVLGRGHLAYDEPLATLLASAERLKPLGLVTPAVAALSVALALPGLPVREREAAHTLARVAGAQAPPQIARSPHAHSRDNRRTVRTLAGPVSRPPRYAGPEARQPTAARPATAPSRPITSPASPLPIAAPSGGGGADALAELQRNPAAPNAGDLLGAVIDQAEMALKRNRPEEVLRFLAAILRLEQRLPEAGGVRRQYAIVVRRICTRPVVEMLARLVTVPKHRTDATLALQRAGAEAVEVLLDLLVAAPTMSERRGVFDALTQMTQ